MLAIEIDGESHYGNELKDKNRDQCLNAYGVTVLRFDDMEVRYNLDKIMKEIVEWIDKREIIPK